MDPLQINTFAATFFNRPDVPGDSMGIAPLRDFDRAFAVAADQAGQHAGDGVVDQDDVVNLLRTKFDTNKDDKLSDGEQAKLREAFTAPIRPGTGAVTDALAARLFAKASPDGGGVIDADSVQDVALRNFLYRADNIDGADSPHADRKITYSDIKRTIDVYAHQGPLLDRGEVRHFFDENPGIVV